MKGKDAPSADGPLFVGQRGGLAVWFICTADGRCGIQCLWPVGQFDEALAAYLEFVERPAPQRQPFTTLPPPDSGVTPCACIATGASEPSAREEPDVPPEPELARQ
ncbi:MAG TPA: hypothetical protein VFB66_13615 [Tepidisphaeraceae bacterium]|jgi:hypothetical protein|nr:hypothetical protein [Tepidisphaeraceae bacterium]